MNSQSSPHVQFHDISISFEDRNVLQNISGGIYANDKIALVGSNGSGKSTLLSCLAGVTTTAHGDIQSTGRISYVKQLDLEIYRQAVSIYRFVSETHQDWWETLAIAEEVFEQSFNAEQLIQDLSGGELIKLELAKALSVKPDILLLDEPTNHLDLDSMRKLENLLTSTETAFIIVSHDKSFINRVVNQVWELDSGNLKLYGGNYEQYQIQKQDELNGQARKYEVKKKELKRAKLAARKEQDRATRNQSKGAKMLNPGEDKFFKGYFGNRSQKKAGTSKVTFDKKLQQISDDMQELSAARQRSLYLDIDIKRQKGLVVSLENATLTLPEGQVLLKDINFSIQHGDRIAITGANGSGKTTLVKHLLYENNQPLLNGQIRYGKPYRTLTVDQKYDIVKPNLTLIENLQQENTRLTYENARRILSNLGFEDHDDVTRRARTLSGGETARLAFAIATSVSIDIIILDEPTNNLDIYTKEIISDALKSFNGTLIVISHDISFLSDIRIQREFQIKDKRISVGKPITY